MLIGGRNGALGAGATGRARGRGRAGMAAVGGVAASRGVASKASMRFVSRSIARTVSQAENAVTSIMRRAAAIGPRKAE